MLQLLNQCVIYGIAVVRSAFGIAVTDLVCRAAVTELVQAAAQASRRVQALQAGPSLPRRTHLSGAEGSTAAAANIPRPPRGLCSPLPQPSICLAGQCSIIISVPFRPLA